MKGLFVHLPSSPPDFLSVLNAHLAHHDPGLRELVITDVRDWDWPTIDASPQAVTTLYIGATEIPWYGPRADTPRLQPWMTSIAGVAGMLTPSYRWQQIEADTVIWTQAARRGLGFYVRQEVGLDAVGDHPYLKDAWEAYLIEMARRAAGFSFWPTLLWSPYIWEKWDSMTVARRAKLKAALTSIVKNVTAAVADPNNPWVVSSENRALTFTIDIQDGRGAQPDESQVEIVNWYNYLKDCGAKVRVNAELFKPDLTPLDTKTIIARLEYYKSQGVPVGCCWQAGYFLLPPPPAPEWVANHPPIT